MIGGDERLVVMGGVIGPQQADLPRRLEMDNVEVQLVDAPDGLGRKIQREEVIFEKKPADGWKADDVFGPLPVIPGWAGCKNIHLMPERFELLAEGFDGIANTVGLGEVAVGKNANPHDCYCISKVGIMH